MTGLADKRMVEWRSEPSTIRIPKPTKLDRARTLGYRAKPGIIVVRQRLIRGGRQRPDIKAGRRSKHSGQRKVLGMNYRHVAEQRASKRFPNMEVINSYFLAKDGRHYWFEVIMADRDHPVIGSDPGLFWVASGKNKGRALRGLTSAGKKSRGLFNKGFGAEKMRPSSGAHGRKVK
ncbi:50S ribosomal protein L15e [Candidatus Woesearchaeota archaeon]|nr:50S ribosomal protein L15e [Candidatus Woesearchaeota archaeon]